MKFSLRQKFLLFSSLILFCNCLLGFAIYESNQKLRGSEKWVGHTEKVIAQTTAVFSMANDIKTDSRDFIITNDAEYAKSISSFAAVIFTRLKAVKFLARDNFSQQQRVDSLEHYIRKRLDFVAKLIDVRKKQGLSASIAYMSANNDKYYSAPIKMFAHDIEQAEQMLLNQRRQASLNQLTAFNRLSVLAFVIMAGFMVILIITVGKYLVQNSEKAQRAAELVIANAELLYQNEEKGKRAAELAIANQELLFQNKEKERRAAELIIANEELLFQNREKEKRAAELVIANNELSYQNEEKEKRAAELFDANEELLYNNNEKEKRAAELVIANNELSYQNREKEKRAVELAFANEALIFQSNVRKIAERNLYKSESRLKEAQAIARTGNFDVNLIDHTDEWSDGLYQIFGLKREDVASSIELFLSLVHVDDRAYVTERIKDAHVTYDSFAIDFRFMHENGSIRYGYMEAKFRFNKDRLAIRLFGIIQDITDLKRADMERTKMVNDLMVRNNDLEQFAYIISHNLRAPVANIIGASNALNDSDVTAEEQDILSKAINTSVIKLDNVVKDLNHILQIKSSINETKEVVNFSELVNDIKESIKNLIEDRVTIEHDFSSLNEYVTIKPYLYSIFYNLISNSIKYRRSDVLGSIIIKSLTEKDTVKLVFTDNGRGIDMTKNKDHVFGLYKRFHPGTEGKGMGLYMVKTQVETLGGKITIKSEENIGSEFIIEFDR
jgi:signal transduction histidine kinase